MFNAEIFKGSECGGLLTVDKLMNTERELIKFSQRRHFSEELDSLQTGRDVSKNSSIFKLYPVLLGGVLRI